MAAVEDISPLGTILMGKAAVISGSSSGIGAETARLFAKCGASVLVSGRDAEKLNVVVQECQTLAVDKSAKFVQVVGEITEENVRKKIIEDAVSAFGKLDILVNNAGVANLDSILKPNLDVFDEIVNVNLRSVYHLTSLAVPYLLQTKGNIVNISSAASVKTLPVSLSYSIVKAALDHFTRNVAAELGPLGVRCNSVNPGVIPTNISRYNPDNTPEKERFYLEKIVGPRHALQRVGHVSEVARAIAFLASEQASFVTGDILLVDGGLGVFSVPLTIPNQ